MTHTCPPGYCDCSQGFDDIEGIGCLLNYTNADEICSDIRTGTLNSSSQQACLMSEYCIDSTGILCGQCKEGYGVGLLTNACNKFPDRLPQFWLFPIYCEGHVYVSFVRLSLLSTISVPFSWCANSSPCCHCQIWCSSSHHLQGIHLLCPDLSHRY